MTTEMQEMVERIRVNEERLDTLQAAATELGVSLERFAGLKDTLAELDAYYGSPAWFADKESQEAGELPADLKCGVLSEDAVYDLLTDVAELRCMMTQILKEGTEGAGEPEDLPIEEKTCL